MYCVLGGYGRLWLHQQDWMAHITGRDLDWFDIELHRDYYVRAMGPLSHRLLWTNCLNQSVNGRERICEKFSICLCSWHYLKSSSSTQHIVYINVLIVGVHNILSKSAGKGRVVVEWTLYPHMESTSPLHIKIYGRQSPWNTTTQLWDYLITLLLLKQISMLLDLDILQATST